MSELEGSAAKTREDSLLRISEKKRGPSDQAPPSPAPPPPPATPPEVTHSVTRTHAPLADVSVKSLHSFHAEEFDPSTYSFTTALKGRLLRHLAR